MSQRIFCRLGRGVGRARKSAEGRHICKVPLAEKPDIVGERLGADDELRRLEKAGICSFKIEGRMKRPEYVAAAVTACKNSLNNINDYNIDEALRAVFSRSGFTKGYFEGKLGKDMFGVRRKEDVEGAAPVLSSLARLYDGESRFCLRIWS